MSEGLDQKVLLISDSAKLHAKTIGRENEPLVIIDDFVAGADALKTIAVQENNFGIADNFYPGLRAPIPLLYTVALAKNLREVIQAYFGFDTRSAKKAASKFSIVTTPLDQLSDLQRIPHFDAASKNSIAAVHYLYDAEDGFGGTDLYRHRASGYEFVDIGRYKRYMGDIKAIFDNPLRRPQGYICGDTEQFERVASVSARYNRLVLYRGSSLHSGAIPLDYNFDPSPQSGRLTITTFIEG